MVHIIICLDFLDNCAEDQNWKGEFLKKKSMQLTVIYFIDRSVSVNFLYESKTSSAKRPNNLTSKVGFMCLPPILAIVTDNIGCHR